MAEESPPLLLMSGRYVKTELAAHSSGSARLPRPRPPAAVPEPSAVRQDPVFLVLSGSVMALPQLCSAEVMCEGSPLGQCMEGKEL